MRPLLSFYSAIIKFRPFSRVSLIDSIETQEIYAARVLLIRARAGIAIELPVCFCGDRFLYKRKKRYLAESKETGKKVTCAEVVLRLKIRRRFSKRKVGFFQFFNSSFRYKHKY